MMAGARAVALALAGVAALASMPVSAQPKPRIWHVQISQIDSAGTLVGEPTDLACPKGGCQDVIQLDVAGKPQHFLAVVTFVARGAYLALQATTPDLGKVIEFEKGFEGPVFIRLNDNGGGADTLRFTLTGTDDADGNAPAIMDNSQSLVFHRKLAPDLTLKLNVTPPTA